MKIVSWNCSWEKGGFNKDKFDYITNEYDPNILIVQECKYNECIPLYLSFLNFTWYGDGKDSKLGIGIFSKEHKFELVKEFRYDLKFRYVIPYSFKLDNTEIILFAVWTKNYIDRFHNSSYIDNIYEAIHHYKGLLKKNVIIIGDFNTADKPEKRNDKHIELLKELENYNIVNRIQKDWETKPTFYMHFDHNNSYTNDYCLASEKIEITNVEIGKPCLNFSDHCPLIVTLSGTGI